MGPIYLPAILGISRGIEVRERDSIGQRNRNAERKGEFRAEHAGQANAITAQVNLTTPHYRAAAARFT